jgi:hypothetical protein
MQDAAYMQSVYIAANVLNKSSQMKNQSVSHP